MHSRDYASYLDDQSSFAKKYRLETEIRATKQDSRSIQEFYNVMLGFWNQLAKMEPRDLSKLSSYKKYQEEHHLVQFLIGLKDEFDPLRRSILCRPFLPSVEEAVCQLKTEETRLKSLSRFSSLSMKTEDADEPASSGNFVGNMAKFAMASVAVAQVSRALYNYFGDTSEPVISGGTDSTGVKILSYNVWFREDLELHNRMKALGDLIQHHSPDVICFQEVTSKIYDIFKQSNWWKAYRCSVSNEEANTKTYFCMQLSKLPVKSFICRPFRNSRMGRELCMVETEVCRGKPLIIATSHLESPSPAPPNWDQMFSEERVAQANEALTLLKNHRNVMFCGDMNWDDELDGRFPLFHGWVDAWTKLRPRENGWTYDTKSNPMLSANRPLQKRLDRFICKLPDFELGSINMIGTEAISGLSYYKEKRVRNRNQTLELPVLPSDHYGLLLEINL